MWSIRIWLNPWCESLCKQLAFLYRLESLTNLLKQFKSLTLAQVQPASPQFLQAILWKRLALLGWEKLTQVQA